MARVLFIQDIAYEYMGVMYLSAYLKQHGHDCDVTIESLGDNLDKKIQEQKPDLIGFSTLTGSFKWALKTATYLKKKYPQIKIIFGGVHVYSNPQKVINCALGFDAKVLAKGVVNHNHTGDFSVE